MSLRMSAAFTETADVETSSDEYARRFAGPVGAWFLARQAATVRELLADLPRGARVLEVGGGHAQLAPALIESGYELLVVGSDESCRRRLAPWLDAGRCRFEVANLVALPFPDRGFDAVLALRLLPHVVEWRRLVAELCRTARGRVVVDYPTTRSANVLAGRLFGVKQRIEKNTRPFTLFSPAEIADAFASSGFRVTASRPQFLFPMVLHRVLRSASLAAALEAPPRALGLTRVFGSPVIAAAERV